MCVDLVRPRWNRLCTLKGTSSAPYVNLVWGTEQSAMRLPCNSIAWCPH
jgi:hypothetical protein